MRPIPAEHLFREHDAGGIDDPAQGAELRGGLQSLAHTRFVGHVDTDESRVRAKLGLELRAAGFVDVRDDDPGALSDEHARGRFA